MILWPIPVFLKCVKRVSCPGHLNGHGHVGPWKLQFMRRQRLIKKIESDMRLNCVRPASPSWETCRLERGHGNGPPPGAGDEIYVKDMTAGELRLTIPALVKGFGYSLRP